MGGRRIVWTPEMDAIVLGVGLYQAAEKLQMSTRSVWERRNALQKNGRRTEYRVRSRIQWTKELDAQILSENLTTLAERTGLEFGALCGRRNKLRRLGGTVVADRYAQRGRHRWTKRELEFIRTASVQERKQLASKLGISLNALNTRRNMVFGPVGPIRVKCCRCGESFDQAAACGNHKRHWCPQCRKVRDRILQAERNSKRTVRVLSRKLENLIMETRDQET